MNIFEKLRSVPDSLVHSMTFPKDLHDLHKSIDENDPENSALDSFSLDRKTSTELKNVLLLSAQSFMILLYRSMVFKTSFRR